MISGEHRWALCTLLQLLWLYYCVYIGGALKPYPGGGVVYLYLYSQRYLTGGTLLTVAGPEINNYCRTLAHALPSTLECCPETEWGKLFKASAQRTMFTELCAGKHRLRDFREGKFSSITKMFLIHIYFIQLKNVKSISIQSV